MGGCRRRGRGDVPECGRSGSRAGGGGHCPIRGVPSRCPPQPGAMAVVLGSSAGRGRGQRGSSEKVWGGFPYLGGGSPPPWSPSCYHIPGRSATEGGMLQPFPSSGGTTPPGGGGVQAGGRRALRGGLQSGPRSLLRRRCPGESGAVPAGGRRRRSGWPGPVGGFWGGGGDTAGGGAAAPGQGTQALKDVGKTETRGSWGSGGGWPRCRGHPRSSG